MATTVIDELIATLGYKYTGQADAKRYEQDLVRIERRAQAVGAAVGRVAAVMATVVTAGFGALTTSIIKTGSQFEALGIQLEALEGSAEGAQKAMAWIKEFAVATPLELLDVAKAYAQLKNSGIDPTKGALLALVDTMAMSGKGVESLGGIITAITQMWNKEKIQAEEMNQLNERGVPAWKLLSEAMGQSTKDVMKLGEQGKLGRKEIQLLIDAMGKRAAGASEKFSKSLVGIWGNIKDLMTDFRQMVNESGFFAQFKARLESILEVLRRWKSDGTMQRFADTLSKFLTGALDKASFAIERFSNHMKFISDNWSKWSDAIEIMGYALTAMLVRAHPLIAGLAALGIVLEDFFTYLQGGDSVIGDLLKEGFSFEEMEKEFKSNIGRWAEILKQGFLDIDWIDLGKTMAVKLWEGFRDQFFGDLKKEFRNFLRFFGLPEPGSEGGDGGTGGGGGGEFNTTPGGAATGRIRRSSLETTGAYGGRRIRGAGPGVASGGGGGGYTVPNVGPMSDEERNNLGLILKYESQNRNVMNYKGRRLGLHPATMYGSTAQGYYQILNSNWRRLAPKLGITTPNAMASTKEEQTKVALALMRERPGTGIGHWRNFNPALRRALARGERVDTSNVPNVTSDTPGPVQNLERNRIRASDTVAGLNGISSSATTNNRIQAPITVNVQRATDAPAAAADAVAEAVRKGPSAAPSRVQASPAQ